jgi:hypothetical protein
MKRDIRDLFTDNEVSEHKLPKGHKEAFKVKLLEVKPNKTSKVFNYKWLYKIAAMLLVFLALGYVLFPKNNTDNFRNTTEFTKQIKTIEEDYLISINKEWESFLLLAKDDNLVSRYKKRLEDLNADYKEIAKQYRDDNTDILMIEALVENLQTRLNLLKDIQKHINLLNQENEHYETTL